jgi:hypothetical protein
VSGLTVLPSFFCHTKRYITVSFCYPLKHSYSKSTMERTS